MKHIKTLNTRKLQNTVKKGGCGECQTSEVQIENERNDRTPARTVVIML